MELQLELPEEAEELAALIEFKTELAG